MLNGVRERRVAHSYRTIAKLEQRIKGADRLDRIGDMRLEFASETFRAIDGVQKGSGIKRAARRRMKRTLLSGKPPKAPRAAGGEGTPA